LVIIATGGVTDGTVDGLELGAKVGILDIEGPNVGTEVGVTELDGLGLILDEGVLVIMVLGFKVGDLDGVKLGLGEGMLVGARVQSPHVIGQSSLVVEEEAERAHLFMLFFPTQSHDFLWK
jgi:hypothetical protein